MPLSEMSAVDMVSKPFCGEDYDIVLWMMDSDAKWDDQEIRYDSFLRKLKAYLWYVTKGTFKSDHSNMPTERILVRVVTVTPANERMLAVESIGTENAPELLKVKFMLHKELMEQLKEQSPSN